MTSFLPGARDGNYGLAGENRHRHRQLIELRMSLSPGGLAAVRARPEEGLLAAVLRALTDWSGNGNMLTLETHGRDLDPWDIDLSRQLVGLPVIRCASC